MTTTPLHRGIGWLRDLALPLWARSGWDADMGSFVERLDLEGRPLLNVPRRVMVQARQLFVMAMAYERGWLPAADELIERGADSMVSRYHAADGQPGWIFSVGRDGTIANRRRDLYAHAFVLLALARIYAVTSNPRFRQLARETLSFLDAHMASPAGGYVEFWPDPPPERRQNPHMHLFEALLAWTDADPSDDWLERAGEIRVLLATRMVQGEPEVVVETFTGNWRAMARPTTFEPGHHFEWAWLLERFSLMTGSTDALPAHLLDVALRQGLTTNGRLLDEVTASGEPKKHSTRLWPLTEAAKAMTTDAARKHNAPSPDRFLQVLQRDFLDPAHPGSWIDHLDVDGSPLSTFAPASSLYHIVCAYDVCSRANRDKVGDA